MTRVPVFGYPLSVVGVNMKKNLTVALNILIFFFGVSPVFGDVSVNLSLDRREATISDSVTLQVRVSGVRKSNAPSISGLEAFHVTSGGSTRRVEIINGRYNAGVDYTYYLQPKQKGLFSIGPATVTADGQKAKSNRVTLKVLESLQTGKTQKGSVFLTAALGDGTPYVEEQVFYTLKLYLRENVSDISLNLPQTDGLTFRQLEKPSEYQGQYDGRTYRVLKVRYGVIPLQPGTFQIPPARMQLTVYDARNRSRRGLFNDPLFGNAFRNGRPLTLAGESLSLVVRPFPKKGKPPDFSGLVGRFDLKGALSESQIPVGDSATFTLTLSGRGNANRLPNLKMPDVLHLKVYADDPVFEAQGGNDGMNGSKTMKWALVPEKEGEFTIPEFELNYFNPKSGKYRTAKTAPFKLNALPGKKESLVTAAPDKHAKEKAGFAKREVTEIGHDILPVYSSASGLETKRAMGPLNVMPWVILLGPFGIYLAVFLSLRLQKRSDRAIHAQRARKAARVFLNECRKDEKDANALLTAIRDYINDRFQLSLGSLTPAEVPKLLTDRGVQPKTAARIGEILEKLESRIYTGGEASCGSTRSEISGLIRQMEKELR